jgi:hypothetical protein
MCGEESVRRPLEWGGGYNVVFTQSNDSFFPAQSLIPLNLFVAYKLSKPLVAGPLQRDTPPPGMYELSKTTHLIKLRI